MKIKVSSLTTARSNSLSIAIVTIAFAIFVVDTQVDVDIDIPVLYVAVVLMSIRLYEVRGVLIVSMGCAVLTLAAYWLSPGDLAGTTAIANRFLAFLAGSSRRQVRPCPLCRKRKYIQSISGSAMDHCGLMVLPWT